MFIMRCGSALWGGAQVLMGFLYGFRKAQLTEVKHQHDRLDETGWYS